MRQDAYLPVAPTVTSSSIVARGNGRSGRRLLLLGSLLLLVVGFISFFCMLRVHDQDVKIYSITPDHRVQVIGLRQRTYLLDYGAGSLVLFATTFNTGILIHGKKEDVYGPHGPWVEQKPLSDAPRPEKDP